MTHFLLRYPYCFPAAIATLFGLCFPILTALFLLWEQHQAYTWDNFFRLHEQHHDLIIMWSAPVVLGLFGNLVGKVHWMLKEQMNHLEHRTLQLNTILDTAASAIVTIDSKGSILSFNHAAELIFGYTLDEIIGKNVNCLMPEEIAIEHDRYIERFIKTQTTDVFGKRREVEARRKNGELFPAMLQVNPMRVDGDLFISGVIDDITDTKNLQGQLIQAQKLEAIGQLASGVAHEINTPIQYIGDNLAALADNINELVAFQQQLNDAVNLAPVSKTEIDALTDKHDLAFILDDSPKAIQQALDGVQRVAEIIKAMRTFSHIEDAQARQIIDIREALTSALTISRNGYKYIADVETDFANDTGKIECYASELNQVFLNLIINAAHAIEEKNAGKGLIKVSTRRQEHTVEILISDNGIGIPAENQEKVFNLFFTTKAVGKGTGQGLSLAHSIIVDKHRGQLFFESTPGIGTTFHIQLPIQLPELAD